MNTFGTTTFTNAVVLAQAAAADTHPVRHGELVALLSGCSPVGHGHTLAELTDWENLGEKIADAVGDSDTVVWTLLSGVPSASVQVKTAGGILAGGDGLYLDDLDGRYTPASHTHLLAEVTDFSASLPAAVFAVLSGTGTVNWSTAEDRISAAVNLKPAGALAADADGIYVDLGTGATQAAAGNHTHAQLHDALTLASSTSLDLSLAGQELTAEVRAVSGGGLTLLSGGLSVAFGTGATQVATGDHTHVQLHDALTVVSTAGLSLALDDQVLSGTPRVDPEPAGERGQIAIGEAGLYTVLGTGANVAAAGNHLHTAASPASDGFLSAADKATLDDLAEAVLSGTMMRQDSFRCVLDGAGTILNPGSQDFFVAPCDGVFTGWEIISDVTVLSDTVVDLWADTYANFPPTVEDSIAGSEKLTLPSGTRIARNLEIATWNQEFDEGDVFCANLDSINSATRLVLQFFYERS